MNRTLLISLGGVAAAVLLFVFVVSPLLFGGDDVDEGPVEVADASDDDDIAHEPAEDPEAETIADEGQAQPVPETFEVFTARDPFQQLVVDDAIPASAEPGEGDGDGDGDGDDADGDGDSDGSEDDDDSDDDGEPSDVEVDGTTVRLEEVFGGDDGDRAQVTVNARGYDVAEGDDFASRFRLLELSDQCATLLYGDQRFTLCEGETIRK